MHHRKRKSHLFFIEFLIVLFFFLIVSTVCLRLFVYARQVTDCSDALSHAQAAAASVAEILSATDGSIESLAGFLPEAALSEDTLTVTYDREFRSCPAEEAQYTMSVFLYNEGTAEDGMTMNMSRPGVPQTKILDPATEKNADITITDQDQEVLYSLSVSYHDPLTRGEVLQ